MLGFYRCLGHVNFILGFFSLLKESASGFAVEVRCVLHSRKIRVFRGICARTAVYSSLQMPVRKGLNCKADDPFSCSIVSHSSMDYKRKIRLCRAENERNLQGFSGLFRFYVFLRVTLEMALLSG